MPSDEENFNDNDELFEPAGEVRSEDSCFEDTNHDGLEDEKRGESQDGEQTKN